MGDHMDNKQFIIQSGIKMLEDSRNRKEHLLDRLRDRFTNIMPYVKNEGRALRTLVSFEPVNQIEQTYIAEKEKIVFQKEDQEYVFSMCENVIMNAGELKYVYEVDKNGIAYDTLQKDGSFLLFQKQSDLKLIDQIIISINQAFAYCDDIAILLSINKKAESILHKLIMENKLTCVIMNGEKQYPVLIQYEQKLCLLTNLDNNDKMQDYKIIFNFHDSFPPLYIQNLSLLIPQRSYTTTYLYRNDMLEDDFAKIFEIPFTQEDCFYIGCSNAFYTKAKTITLSFLIEMQIVEKNISHEEVKYHWFMRHLPQEQKIYDAYAQQVVFEYFNGEKWVIFEELLPYQTIFTIDKSRYVSITLQSISNWQPIEINASNQHYLRIRLLQSEHNYQESVRYHVPYMRDLKITVEQYDLTFTSVIRKNINEKIITEKVKTGYLMKEVVKAHSIYMGFQNNIPYSMYMHLSTMNKFGRMNSYIYYKDTFVPLEMIDESAALSKSGKMLLGNDTQYSLATLFDHEAYWLRFDMLDACEECCIDKVYYHVGEAVEEQEETLYFTLNELNYEFKIPFANIQHMQIYVKEQDWIEWDILDYPWELNKDIRNVYYSMNKKQLQFHPDVLEFFDIANTENNIWVTFVSTEHLTTLPVSSANLYVANERVSAVFSVVDAYGYIAQESNQQIKQHTSQLCSTFNRIICYDDLQKWLYSKYPTITQCKMNIDEQKIALTILFKYEKQDCDQQILLEIKQQLLSLSYLKNMLIQVQLPITIKAMFILKATTMQKDLVKVKECLEEIITRHLKWEIGVYPDKLKCKQEIRKVFSDLQLLEFEIYLQFEKDACHYVKKIEDCDFDENAIIIADKHSINIQRRTI